MDASCFSLWWLVRKYQSHGNWGCHPCPTTMDSKGCGELVWCFVQLGWRDELQVRRFLHGQCNLYSRRWILVVFQIPGYFRWTRMSWCANFLIKRIIGEPFAIGKICGKRKQFASLRNDLLQELNNFQRQLMPMTGMYNLRKLGFHGDTFMHSNDGAIQIILYASRRFSQNTPSHVFPPCSHISPEDPNRLLLTQLFHIHV